MLSLPASNLQSRDPQSLVIAHPFGPRVRLATLEATEGSTARAAEMLDLSVRTIQYRLHENALAAKNKRS